jgi:hypothetical protein
MVSLENLLEVAADMLHPQYTCLSFTARAESRLSLPRILPFLACIYTLAGVCVLVSLSDHYPPTFDRLNLIV